MFWFRLNILCRVPGYRGHVVRREPRREVFRLGKRISKRCVAPVAMLIILADGTRGQGLGLNLGSRDGCHQGLYRQGGEVGSGSRFLGRRNRFGRSGARSPGRPFLRFRPAPASPPLSGRRFAPLGCQLRGRPLAPALFWTAVRGSTSVPREKDPSRWPDPPARRGGFDFRPRPGPHVERGRYRVYGSDAGATGRAWNVRTGG